MEYPEDILEPELAPYALAVGALCNEWAKLESAIHCLFMSVSRMPHSRVSFGMVHCLDVRDSISAIKIAFADKGDERLTQISNDILNYIHNVLRIHRNRYVHDMWVYWDDSESVGRFNYSPKILKPQVRKGVDWTPLSIGEDELPEIWDAVRDTASNTNGVSALQSCFHDQEGALSALLESPPSKLLLRRQSEKKSGAE